MDLGENIVEGLIREVHEETGLIIRPRSSIAHVESEMIHGGKYDGRLYVVLFYAAQTLGGTLKLSDEHETAFWAESHEAGDRELTRESQVALAAFRNMGIV